MPRLVMMPVRRDATEYSCQGVPFGALTEQVGESRASVRGCPPAKGCSQSSSTLKISVYANRFEQRARTSPNWASCSDNAVNDFPDAPGIQAHQRVHQFFTQCFRKHRDGFRPECRNWFGRTRLWGFP